MAETENCLAHEERIAELEDVLRYILLRGIADLVEPPVSQALGEACIVAEHILGGRCYYQAFCFAHAKKKRAIDIVIRATLAEYEENHENLKESFAQFGEEMDIIDKAVTAVRSKRGKKKE